MGKAFDRLKEGLEEVLSITKGEQPAASITVNGHVYVPKAELDEALRRYDERNRTAIERAGYAARCAELESELAGCQIALEQAWESSRERQADIEQFMQRLSPQWFLAQGWFPSSMEANKENDDGS